MSSKGRYFAITNTKVEWFEKAKRGEIDVWHFPPGKRPKVGQLQEGDPIVFLSYADEGCEFLGEAEFVEAREVSYEEFNREYKERALEVEKAPFPKPGERCWIMVLRNFREYERKVKKRESPFSNIPIIGLNPFTERYWEKLELLRRMASTPLTISVKEYILKKLTDMSPRKFEYFISHLLQIMGFEVEQTGSTRDGGVDIKGMLFTDITSIRLKVQVKRWKDNVGSEVVRNLRGALDQTLGEGGVIITTSDFTKDAYEEAERRGARKIDLINGERLVELILKYYDKLDDEYKKKFGLRRKPLYEQFEVV